ncbi:MAG: hypothetical protein EAZ57_00400 [Cytophagales bacterium]|nr:MAG: hypothetical protein EAZ67_00730 [Cytophagales bacterium]TAF62253.1 MAG: hypothetical protein EAZ57_00400 [Cytophagales bacterium]
MFQFAQKISNRTWLVIGVCTAFVLLGLGLFVSFSSKEWSFVYALRVNDALEKSKRAYEDRFYNVAAQKLSYLQDTLLFQDKALGLNLAHATALKKDTSALALYKALSSAEDSMVRSVANQQIGVNGSKKMQSKEDIEKMAEHFKESIRAMASNDDARFNYEVLMRILQQQQNQQQSQDKQNQQQNEKQKEEEQKKKEEEQKQREQNEQDKKQDGKKDNNEQDKGQEKDQDRIDKKSAEDQLKDMKMTPEKAKELLAALRNNEMQYFQQPKKRKLKAKGKNVKDW